MAHNIQGITKSNNYWFISNQYNIYRVPVDIKLTPRNFLPDKVPFFDVIKIPDCLVDLGYNHFGGISVLKNYLLVALERKTPMKILFFNQENLNLDFVYDVPNHFESLSWVAASEESIYFSENRMNNKKPLYQLKLNQSGIFSKRIKKKILFLHQI